MAYSIFKGPIELPSPIMVEGEAQESMTPGHIIDSEFAVGDATTIGQLLILRDGGQGKGEGIDYAYANGDYVSAYKARQGLIFAVRAATGVALVKGVTLLERGASGRLTILDEGVAVAVADETVTTTANDQLVQVEIL